MMTRSKSLLAAAGVGVSALLVAAPAKAFIVFAPAVFAGVIIGAVAAGSLFGHAAAVNHWFTTPAPPAAVYTSAGEANGCYPAAVRIKGRIHHVQVCD